MRLPPATARHGIGLALSSLTGAALLTGVLGIIVLMLGLRWGVQQLQAFALSAQTTPGNLITTGLIGLNTTPRQTDGRINILILGLDSLATRGDARALTDTIMIASLNTQTGEIKAVSLPRDLWVPEQQTRINSLYFYGQEKYPDKPQQLPAEIISQMINLPIHHTVVITLDEVGELIDFMGGVTVDVKTGFVDPLFPRPDVDVTTVTDPKLLYQTVEFKPGVQTFNGTVALQYIRSRHSTGSEGSDIARSFRQQQVIASLMSQINQPQVIQNPEFLAQLYVFYRQHFSQYLPTTEAIAIAKTLFPHRQQIKFEGQSVSIYPEVAEGVLVHPPLSAYNGQWLYVIRDQQAFTTEIKTKLGLASTTTELQ